MYISINNELLPETNANISPALGTAHVMSILEDFTLKNGAYLRQRNWVQNGLNSIKIGGNFTNNGEMITAYKTLKHFEKALPTQFFRIHNSFIVNKDYISRIHTGNNVCFLKNSKAKLPFSKSYKSNVDQIIASISSSDYLEI